MLFDEFQVPSELCDHEADSVDLLLPSGRLVEIALGSARIGLVRRARFDAALRDLATAAGAVVRQAIVSGVRTEGGGYRLRVAGPDGGVGDVIRCRSVVGADGAGSTVRRLIGEPAPTLYTAIQERWTARKTPAASRRLAVDLRAEASGGYYGWIFPKGTQVAVGTAAAPGGAEFLPRFLAEVRRHARGSISGERPLCTESAPIPVSGPSSFGRGRIVLAGDAAGTTAPGSGEGIFYAMKSGRFAARALLDSLRTGDPDAATTCRRAWERLYGATFAILKRTQGRYYTDGRRRERFGRFCADPHLASLAIHAFTAKAFPELTALARAGILLRTARIALAG